MNLNRERIIAAFESMRRLLCDIGFFVEGNAEKGVWLRFWGNRHVRELKVFRNGVQNGFAVKRLSPMDPPHYSHFKNGKPYGEATWYYSSGRVLEHWLLDGEDKIPYSSENAAKFEGYLTTDSDEELYHRFARYPSREVFIGM